MALIRGKQIAGSSIAAAKLDLTDTFDFSSGTVSVATPSASAHAATKAYVDSTVTGGQAGLDFKESVRAASTDDIGTMISSPAFTYSSGVFTATTNAADTITFDGFDLSVGDRILVKNQTNTDENGIYYLSQQGDGSSQPTIITRTTDADSSSDLTAGAYVFVENGTLHANQGFVLQAYLEADPTVNTDPLVFIQFSGAGQITAGDGLAKSGDTLNLDVNDLTAFSGIVNATSTNPDYLAFYDTSATSTRKISVNELFSDSLSSTNFTEAGGVFTVKLRSSYGLAVGGVNGLEIDSTNMAGATLSTLSGGNFIVSDVAGRPLTRSYANVAGDLAGTGLTYNSTSFAIDAAVPQQESGNVASNLSSDESATGITLSTDPVNGASLQVLINGVAATLKGDKTGDCYFSADSGSTARALADIVSGDELIWQGASVYTLATTDEVVIRYMG